MNGNKNYITISFISCNIYSNSYVITITVVKCVLKICFTVKLYGLGSHAIRIASSVITPFPFHNNLLQLLHFNYFNLMAEIKSFFFNSKF